MTNAADDKEFFLKNVSNWALALGVFAASLTVFSLFNWDREMLRLECRFMVFAKELLNGAPLGLFPSLYGAPYVDYPSSSSLLALLLAKAHGSLTAFALTFPVGLAVAGATTACYLTGAEISKKLGLAAALLLLCTYGFIDGGRSVAMDAFVCLGAACAFRFSQLSASRNGVWSVLHFCLGLLSIAVAFAFRGPIGGVVASAAFIAWPAGALEWRKTLLAALGCGAFFALLTAAFFAAAWNEGGQALLSKALEAQAGGRISGSGKPVYLYFVNGMAEYAGAFPLAMIALIFARKSVWRRNGSEEIKLFGRFMLFGLLIVVGLTAPSTRHLRYILPAIPGFALAAACLWAFPEAFELPAKLGKLLRWLDLKKLALAAGILCALSVFVIDPLETKMESSRAFVEKIDAELPSADGYAFYDLGPDGEELKLLCESRQKLHVPQFVSEESELAAVKLPVVASEKSYDKLPLHLKSRATKLLKGKLGHKRCVAFVLKDEKSSAPAGKAP